MSLTLEQPTEIALTTADVWTVPGVQTGPDTGLDSVFNHGFGSGDAGESRLLEVLESAFVERRRIDARIAGLTAEANRMMTTPRTAEYGLVRGALDTGTIPIDSANPIISEPARATSHSRAHCASSRTADMVR